MIYNSNRKTTIAIRLENKSYHDCCCKIIFWFIGSPQAHTMPHPVHRQSLVPHRYVVFLQAAPPARRRHPDSWQHRQSSYIPDSDRHVSGGTLLSRQLPCEFHVQYRQSLCSVRSGKEDPFSFLRNTHF